LHPGLLGLARVRALLLLLGLLLLLVVVVPAPKRRSWGQEQGRGHQRLVLAPLQMRRATQAVPVPWLAPGRMHQGSSAAHPQS
jgi:hypothetical protein